MSESERTTSVVGGASPRASSVASLAWSKSEDGASVDVASKLAKKSTSRQSSAGSASSRVARQGTFTYPVPKPGSAGSMSAPSDGGASIVNAVKKTNVVAPIGGEATTKSDEEPAISAFANQAYVNAEDDIDDDDDVSTASMSKSESFSTDTYKKSKSKRLPASQHQPSFLQKLVETAKVAPHNASGGVTAPVATIPKSETVATDLRGVNDDDDEAFGESTRPPPVMRSLSASPTFTVKKEKGHINEEVILDRITDLASERKHEFDDDDVDDDENDDKDATGSKKASSLPTSPSHRPKQQQQGDDKQQLVPYTNIQNKQMYIPLNVAREYIGKMSGEMKSMKENHLTIVQQIEEAYRRIEDETQNQFVIYVQGLKQHYVTKIISLRSVLDLHQKEISKKESYWEASIRSLQERYHLSLWL